MTTSLPATVLNSIKEGRAILFLGAGASYDGILRGAPTKITADKLKEQLSDRFLGGMYKDRPLMTVADFARNEGSLREVQAFVRDVFKDLQPNDFHELIPRFRWKAIVTTNYDLVVEQAYGRCRTPMQELRPITRDGDQLQRSLSEQNALPYLKLHGCINEFSNLDVPIVLDSLEYMKFAAGRSHMTTALKEWAANHPVLFCGYSISDENIKQILFDLGDSSQVRPLFLYASPGLSDIEERYWSAKRIAPFKGTFAELLRHADLAIPAAARSLAGAFSASPISVSKWIPSHTSPSDALRRYLDEELLHVLPDSAASTKLDVGSFYSGLDTSFGPIYQELDVRRRPVDEILESVVLNTMESTAFKFFYIERVRRLWQVDARQAARC
jgi:hypothetical protein